MVAGGRRGGQIPAPVGAFRFPVRATLIVSLLLAAAPVSAQTNGGEGPGLLGPSLSLGARAIGRGRAVVATRAELQAMPYNPAAIVELERGGLTYSRFEAADETGLSGNYLAGGVATPWGTVALHATLLDYGDIPVTDDSPEPIGSIEISDWIVGVSYAGRILEDRLAFGATAKWVSASFGSVEAGGPAFDGGVNYSPRAGLPLSFAVSLRNVGPDLDFAAGQSFPDVEGAESREETLPARVRIGVNLHPEEFLGLPPEYVVEVGFDIESDLRELATSSQHAGIQATIHETIVLRGGLLLLDNPFAVGSTENRNAGGSLGVGVRYGGFEADIAREISVSELGDEMHFAVGWRF